MKRETVNRSEFSLRSSFGLAPAAALLLLACPSQETAGPCPTLTHPNALAENGQVTWVFDDPDGTTTVDETLSGSETPCAASLRVLRDPERPLDGVAEGETVDLHFQVSVGCQYPDREGDGAGLSFPISTDLRREMPGSVLRFDTVRPDLGYDPHDGGPHCRWNGLPLYEDEAGTPAGNLEIEVLGVQGSEAPYPELVSDDFEMRLEVTYTAPSSFFGVQQIDGALEPCPRTIASVDTSFEVVLTAQHFALDRFRICGTGG